MDLYDFEYTTARKFSERTVDLPLTKELIRIVSSPKTYGEQYGDCFEPHFGFTFISDVKPVFTILVCFECGFLESTETLPASRKLYYDIESYDQNNNPILVRRYKKGFSKSGKKKLLGLCDTLSMQYCIDYNAKK